MGTSAEFIIPERGLKLFYKMLQCCLKAGEELHLDATRRKITFRSLNTSRSAYFAFSYGESFFEGYKLLQHETGGCKVHLKSCIAVFKSVQNVQECHVRIDNEAGKVIFDATCKYDMKKFFRINYEECEVPQALYTKESCKSHFVCQPKLLSESLANFHTAVDEVTITVNPAYMKIKSYFDDHDMTQTKVLQTELAIDSKDFEEFVIDGDVGELTFCLKEFKAILAYCEFTGQPMHMFVEKAGRPITFSVNVGVECEADFVLATLVDTATQSSQNSASRSQQRESIPPAPPSISHAEITNPETPSPTRPDFEQEQKPIIGESLEASREAGSESASHVRHDQHLADESAAPDSGNQPNSVPLVESSRDEDDEYVEGTPPASPEEERSSKRARVILGTQTYDHRLSAQE